MKISVIVPAYNVEAYLSETLDSLAAQTFDDFEVIIVNDGSKDGTQKIIDSYAEKYPFMRGVYQENAGVSAARNTGISVAEGEYIAFLDGDDLFTPETLEALYEAAEENDSDLVVGKIQNFEGDNVTWQEHAKSMSEMVFINPFDKRMLWNFLIGNKLYKAELLRSSHSYFPPLKYSEDGAFLMHYVYNCRRINGCENAVLRYRRHTAAEERSVSQSISFSLLRDYIEAHTLIYNDAKEAIEKLPEEIRPEGYLDEILYKTAHVLLSQFYRLFWRTDDECRAYIKERLTFIWERVSDETKAKLLKSNRDIEVVNLIATGKEMADNPRISVIIKNIPDGNEKTGAFIDSIYNQAMPAFEVFVPQKLFDSGKIPEQWLGCENLRVLPDKKFVKTAKAAAKSDYKIVFSKPCEVDKRVFRFAYTLWFIPSAVKKMMFSSIIKETIKFLKKVEERRE